ncbi:apolipoprotein N-acyltransferase [Roseibium aestuarii]|uniref:Apolipoprotein N-acyltransferase n=1 Tax=Roseibium aestuarii TaxID=2600299 RepID=A0ABW4K3I7_9HYPH|nr:apolipoprotein N-acyltransferase [Roseibium aestuarii]
MSGPFAALSAVPNACLLAWGGRRRLYAVVAGVVAALSLPPVDLSVLLLLAIPGLVWLLDGALSDSDLTRRQRMLRGFSVGWFFGFGYFLAGLWWVGSAFLVDGDRYAWLMPFAVTAMPVGLALFHGAALALAALFWTPGGSRILVLAITLSLSDWLRGHVLTGFPWNSFGYGVAGSLELSQTASLVGLYGLGLLVLLIAAAPALLTGELKTRWRGFGAATLLLVAMGVFGLWRLHAVEEPGLSDLDVRIVQPAIPQDEKWVPENRDRVFSSYLDLSSRPLGEGARVGAERLIIWPESAVPFLLTRTPTALVAISALLHGENQLATGAIRLEQGETPEASRYYNSLYLFDPDGEISGAYDKLHLVPFGEYLPLSEIFEALGISRLVQGPGVFEPGFARMPLTLRSGKTLLPLICYEAIFPNELAMEGGRPDLILNVTNDAWFGHTAGPYQHLAQARLRAIEQGLPLVRAANTGISAVVDAKGRFVTRLELGERAVADAAVPKALQGTVYTRLGSIIYAILLILLAILASYYRYNPYSRKN